MFSVKFQQNFYRLILYSRTKGEYRKSEVFPSFSMTSLIQPPGRALLRRFSRLCFIRSWSCFASFGTFRGPLKLGDHLRDATKMKRPLSSYTKRNKSERSGIAGSRVIVTSEKRIRWSWKGMQWLATKKAGGVSDFGKRKATESFRCCRACLLQHCPPNPSLHPT